jgi:D-alanine-D-alanine ligase
MLVAILHNDVAHPAATPDDQDVLVQVAVVREALRDLGHRVAVLACDLNLQAVREQLQSLQPDVVFNLVESLGGTDQLLHLVPALLDSMALPYTGTAAPGLWTTTDKLAAKRRLRDWQLPTPDWLELPTSESAGQVAPGRYVLKAVNEHASFCLDERAVVSIATAEELFRELWSFSRRVQRTCFAERYIHGREFNLSLLSSASGATVLPVAEIEFLGFPPDQPRIVGYRAKWDERSREYLGTPRTFEFPESDRPLLSRLQELALACWRRFAMRGYARVDFRVDKSGQPWILEINANPCLSPDAGFAAALQRAGVPLPEALARILADVPGPMKAGRDG